MTEAELRVLAHNLGEEGILSLLKVIDRVHLIDAVSKIANRTDPHGATLYLRLSETNAIGHPSLHPSTQPTERLPRPYGGGSSL